MGAIAKEMAEISSNPADNRLPCLRYCTCDPGVLGDESRYSRFSFLFVSAMKKACFEGEPQDFSDNLVIFLCVHACMCMMDRDFR